jgi:hypothetical protein
MQNLVDMPLFEVGLHEAAYKLQRVVYSRLCKPYSRLKDSGAD